MKIAIMIGAVIGFMLFGMAACAEKAGEIRQAGYEKRLNTKVRLITLENGVQCAFYSTSERNGALSCDWGQGK